MTEYETQLRNLAQRYLTAAINLDEKAQQLAAAKDAYDAAAHAAKVLRVELEKCVGPNVCRRVFPFGHKAVTVHYIGEVARVYVDDLCG